MRSHKDVEAYLLRMDRKFDEVSEGTYAVALGTGTLVVKCAEPLVVARVPIGELPPQAREALYEHLLRLNATALVHSAYGIDGTGIVLAAALELENLDFNELDALLAEFDLALAEQLPAIRALCAGDATVARQPA